MMTEIRKASIQKQPRELHLDFINRVLSPGLQP